MGEQLAGIKNLSTTGGENGITVGCLSGQTL